MIDRLARGQVRPPRPLLRPDGSRFALAVSYGGNGWIAYGDVPADLLDALIPGYCGLDDQARLVARIRLAYRAAVAAQALVLAEADSKELRALRPRERAALLRPQHEAVRLECWSSPIPLVLVDTAYAPFTSVDRPISAVADVVDPPNMMWLRPQDEWELLESLARSGYVQGLYEAL
ncbi:hypothetical protein GTQ99_02410 [Kineococcus sp. T13]|uniref:hypothetical protein n=1 Tax=Kineococcus vitellinus TaxID=2696565 RepID=UPI001412D0B8|nr:hypothetical protein [Kineococcus vitellinus]NAZ74281.1 hypothetical protein [Kineococcus vitellinus]